MPNGNPGLDSWTLTSGEAVVSSHEEHRDPNRWYGRGVADNKGQHLVVLDGLAAVLATRPTGQLGFNAKILIEMGEEAGSPGIHELVRSQHAALSADLFLASDGPRLLEDRPTLYMGSRGATNFELSVRFREGGNHSGNFGGLLRNPAIYLCHALATLTGPNGEIKVPEWRHPALTPELKASLADCTVDVGVNGPQIDEQCGEPGLTPAERVFGWNSFEILGLDCSAIPPANAIPGTATAYCQLRYIVGSEVDKFRSGVEEFLRRQGFPEIEFEQRETAGWNATRMLPDNPWVRWAAESVQRTTGTEPGLLPNLGGSLPNDAFSEILGLPTIWVPHSYPACQQHAANEHSLKSILREGLAIMAGLFWDFGEEALPLHGHV